MMRAAGLLVVHQGHVVLQRRSRYVDHSGSWSIPAGAIERGEAPHETALRESMEEVAGIDGMLRLQAREWHHGNFATVHATLDAPSCVNVKPRTIESTDARWVPIEDVTEYALHPLFAESWHEIAADLRSSEPANTDETVTGWRFAAIEPRQMQRACQPRNRPHGVWSRPQLRAAPSLPFSEFDDAGIAGPALCDPDYPALKPLYYDEDAGEHDAPGIDCHCGYRVVPDPGQLRRYIAEFEQDLRRVGATQKPPLQYVCGVTGFGTVVASGPRFSDPPGTWRVSHLRLTGPVLLPSTGTGRATARLLSRITPAVPVQYVDDPRKVTAEMVNVGGEN